jgi:hypothetical protein
MDSMEQIISLMGMHLGAMAKLNPFSSSWRVGGSNLSEGRFMTVERLWLEWGETGEQLLERLLLVGKELVRLKEKELLTTLGGEKGVGLGLEVVDEVDVDKGVLGKSCFEEMDRLGLLI